MSLSRTARGRVKLAFSADADPRQVQQESARGVEQLQRGRGRFPVVYRKDTADGAANTATAETLLFQNAEGFDRVVEHVTITPLATVAKVAANYAKIQVFRRLVDGGDDSALAIGTAGRRRIPYVLAELSSTSITWPLLTATPFTFTGPTLLKAGELLTFGISKLGAGVIVPVSIITVWLVDA